MIILLERNDQFKQFYWKISMSFRGSVRQWLGPRPDLKSGYHGFKSRSDHKAVVVSQLDPIVQLLGLACK